MFAFTSFPICFSPRFSQFHSTRGLGQNSALKFVPVCFKNFIGVQLLYNFVLVSIVQEMNQPNTYLCVHAQLLQSCLTLCDPMDQPESSVRGIFPDKNTGVGCHALLQGIFWTQELNLCLLHLLHGRQILYPLGATGKQSTHNYHNFFYIHVYSSSFPITSTVPFCCLFSPSISQIMVILTFFGEVLNMLILQNTLKDSKCL